MSWPALRVRPPRPPSALRLAALVATLLLGAAGALQAGAPAPEPDEPEPTSAAVGTVPEARAPGSDPSEARDASRRSPPGHAPARPVQAAVPAPPGGAGRPVLDPAARLLRGGDAHEAWTLLLDLESGHRITQRFLLTNVGPGEHSAVAIGHLVEPGRAPYRYENGRRRSRWTLSEDRLFFDIAASHLDLHRPRGELRITKDDIELRFFFAFAPSAPSATLPASRRPADYHVDVLAIGAETTGTILAPWMREPLATRGRAWLVHTWSEREEAALLARRVEIFGATDRTSFYAIQLRGRGDWSAGWTVSTGPMGRIIESPINEGAVWTEKSAASRQAAHPDYPLPLAFGVPLGNRAGSITLEGEWLRFDPLEVIPQPFRWFIRRASQPREVWANAQIGGSLFVAPETPPLPHAGETQRASSDANASHEARGSRETEDLTAVRSVTGVASITFLNPVERR